MMMILRKSYLLIIAILITNVNLFPKDVVIGQNNTKDINLSGCISFIEDSFSVLSVNQLEQIDKWQPLKGNILSKPVNNSTYWYKIQINNSSDNHFLFFDYFLLDFLDVYYFADSGLIHKTASGNRLNFNQRENLSNYHYFKIPKGSFTCFIRLQSILNFQFPLKIINSEKVNQIQTKSYLVIGWNFGVLLLLVVVHLFVYVNFKEIIYIYYVFYMMFLVVSFATHLGITSQFLWPSHPIFNDFLHTYISLGFVFMGLFVMDLLKIKSHYPNYSKAFNLFFFIFIFSGILNFFNRLLSIEIIQHSIPIFNMFLFYIGVKTFLSKRDLFSLYFIVVWTIHLFFIIIFLMVLKGFIVSNFFTRYSAIMGNFFEAVMFSFLLIYRFKLLQNEKDEVQIKELNLRIEKQQMLEDYTQSLEDKVEQAMNDIEKYQSDLVQSEKMNSLALISSGISHEINGAIHLFNSSISIIERNIKVLNDYTQRYDNIEIDNPDIKENIQKVRNSSIEYECIDDVINESDDCIKRAQSGINRIVSITNSLNYFTMSDTNLPLTSTDINKVIKSLVTLQKAILPSGIKVDMKLGELPLIHLKAKNLNQAFLSVFEFSLHAIKSKSIPKGFIKIETKSIGDQIIILFSDDGVALSDNDLQNIFDPFHLNRVVGSRGLGLSAAYRAVKEHGGDIEVNAEHGKGTTFKITLSLN